MTTMMLLLVFAVPAAHPPDALTVAAVLLAGLLAAGRSLHR